MSFLANHGDGFGSQHSDSQDASVSPLQHTQILTVSGDRGLRLWSRLLAIDDWITGLLVSRWAADGLKDSVVHENCFSVHFDM